MTSRYFSTVRRTRREMLKLSAGTTLAAVLAACSKSSGSTTSDTKAPAASSGAAAASTSASQAPAASEAAATTAAATTAVATAPAGPAFDTANQVKITYTYAVDQSAGGRFKNPFQAVWIEDANGLLVRTVGLALQTGRGQRWWPELRRWWRASEDVLAQDSMAYVQTVASPTREPGVNEFIWDGKDESGNAVPLGTYKLSIEAAREHGPYDLLEYDLVLDNAPMTANLEPSGDLQEVSVAIGPA